MECLIFRLCVWEEAAELTAREVAVVLFRGPAFYLSLEERFLTSPLEEEGPTPHRRVSLVEQA